KSGNFWLSTFNGIAKFDPASYCVRNFYNSDGLQSNQFNYNAAIRLSSGEFVFGGIKGFNLFFPDSIKEDVSAPKLMLTELRINNRTYEDYEGAEENKSLFRLESLVVPFNDAVFSISFAALEYSSPDKIKYAYFLEGWDKEWNYVDGQRQANYSKLSEGNYTLRIKSTDANGEWSSKEKVIKIQVLPPWWRTNWAYGAYAFVV